METSRVGALSSDVSRSSHTTVSPAVADLGLQKSARGLPDSRWAAGSPATSEVEDMEAGCDTRAVRRTICVAGPKEAVSTTHPDSVELVVKLKLAVIDPAGMLTVAGTCIPLLLDTRVIVALAPAPPSETVQFPGSPGLRTVVPHASDESLTGVVAFFKDRTAVAVVDPRDAVMVAV